MNFRDTLVTCKQCGKEFYFTVEKQRQLAEQGLPVVAPDLCDDCTKKIKYGGKLHGRIKWFSPEKGYGFITSDEGGDVYVHRQGILVAEDGSLPALEDGQQVLYEVMDTPRGPQAVQVVPYQD